MNTTKTTIYYCAPKGRTERDLAGEPRFNTFETLEDAEEAAEMFADSNGGSWDVIEESTEVRLTVVASVHRRARAPHASETGDLDGWRSLKCGGSVFYEDGIPTRVSDGGQASVCEDEITEELALLGWAAEVDTAAWSQASGEPDCTAPIREALRAGNIVVGQPPHDKKQGRVTVVQVGDFAGTVTIEWVTGETATRHVAVLSAVTF